MYSPLPHAREWDQEDHMIMMLVTTLFCVHLVSILILMMSIGYLIRKCYMYGVTGVTFDSDIKYIPPEDDDDDEDYDDDATDRQNIKVYEDIEYEVVTTTRRKDYSSD